MNADRLVPLEWPRWALMWTMAGAIYTGCKWLTWQRAAVHHVPAWKHAAYLLAWPGLDAKNFLEAGCPSRCRVREGLAAAGKLTLGATLLFGFARTIPPQHTYIVGWTGMIGIILILHFGLFHLLSCSWRSIGVAARRLMNRPWASTSLSEFWGRRWNTAFRDLTFRFLFRPCASWFGPRWGILAGFLFSGVIHDLVISVPAGGGYGGPTVFFALQGAGMMVERSALGRRMGLGSGWPGRLFAAAVLFTPVGLLFHRPFVIGIIVPFMRALGAI
jgi:alginate O-acetyltransferase complex protein AlgI